MNLHKNIAYYRKADETIRKVGQEMRNGFALLNKIHKPIVSIFGSHRVKVSSQYFNQCEVVAGELGKAGFAVVTGGGPGIMRAANLGANNVGAPSIGFKAALLRDEQASNDVFTHELDFDFLFVRRFLLAIKSHTLLFYPGGYGTLNELFEYLTLMETGVVDTVPIICVDKKFWYGLFRWLQRTPLKRDFLKRKDSLKLVSFANTANQTVQLVSKKT